MDVGELGRGEEGGEGGHWRGCGSVSGGRGGGLLRWEEGGEVWEVGSAKARML